MSAAVQEYRDLLAKFLIGNVTVGEFEVLFLVKFKNETRQLEQRAFSVLNELLGDIEAFGDDRDEAALRVKVESAVTQLGILDT